jgi:hypothetical protein
VPLILLGRISDIVCRVDERNGGEQGRTPAGTWSASVAHRCRVPSRVRLRSHPRTTKAAQCALTTTSTARRARTGPAETLVALAKSRRVGVTTMRVVLHQRKNGPAAPTTGPGPRLYDSPGGGAGLLCHPMPPTYRKRRFGRGADIPLRRRRSQMPTRQPGCCSFQVEHFDPGPAGTLGLAWARYS